MSHKSDGIGVARINFSIFSQIATLQVATILVSMAPKILELATWFVKKSPWTKRVGCQMATKQKP